MNGTFCTDPCPEEYTSVIEYAPGEAAGYLTVLVNLPTPAPGACAQASVTIEAEPNAPPGATVQITIRANSTSEGTCSPPQTASCSVTLTVVIGQVDLGVDSDNDGDIDTADDAIEEQFPGKWGWRNSDDSDTPPNLVLDNVGTDADHINGATDLNEDIGMLRVHAIDASLAADPQVYLTIDNLNIRAFSAYAPAAVAILGPGIAQMTRNVNEYLTPGSGGGFELHDFGMEGVAKGSTIITLDLYDGQNLVCSDRVIVTVIDLEVEWHRLDLSEIVGPPNDHPSGTVGHKYFPDASAPNGPWNNLVKVYARTDPAVSGITVHLESLDPDDPSANDLGNPVDPDLLGGDNDTEASGNQTASVQTGSEGIAILDFYLAHHPGDNHRIAATLKQASLQKINNDNVPPSGGAATSECRFAPNDCQPWAFIGHVSPLLTIWRKLHVELDSWGPGGEPPAATNKRILDQGIETNHPSHRWAKIQNLNLGPAQNGRLEGGRLTVSGGGTYVILDNISEAGGDKIYVEDPNGAIMGDVGKNSTAIDDDGTFTPRKPDISLMNPKYRPAYVMIEEVPAESTLTIPFHVNLSLDADEAEVATAPGRSGALATSNTYWTSQIVLAYQGVVETDFDPDHIYHFWTPQDFKWGEDHQLFGQTPPPNWTGYDNFSTIFWETARDYAAWTVIHSQPPFGIVPVAQASDIERVTVVHEVGHQFGIYHPARPMNSIMDDGVVDPALEFSPSQLQIIRSSPSPESLGIAQP